MSALKTAPNYLTLDPNRYARLPMVPVASLLLVADNVLKRLPKKGALAGVRDRLVQVVDSTRERLIRRGEQEAQGSEVNRRQIDAQADRLWRAVHATAEALDALGPDAPRAQKARQLVERYLEDMSFLNLPYGEQYLAMEVKLKRIEKNGDIELFNQVVGPEFHPALVEIMVPYKKMVDGAVDGDEPNESLAEPRRLLAASLVQTAMAVLGAVDPTSEKSVAAAVKILRPLEVLRSQHKRKAAPGEVVELDEDADIEDPTPDETPAA